MGFICPIWHHKLQLMISRDYNQMKTNLAFGIGSLLSPIFQPNPILYKFGWKLGWSISDSAKIGRILRLGARSRIDLKTDPILMKSRPGLGSNRGGLEGKIKPTFWILNFWRRDENWKWAKLKGRISQYWVIGCCEPTIPLHQRTFWF